MLTQRPNQVLPCLITSNKNKASIFVAHPEVACPAVPSAPCHAANAFKLLPWQHAPFYLVIKAFLSMLHGWAKVTEALLHLRLYNQHPLCDTDRRLALRPLPMHLCCLSHLLPPCNTSGGGGEEVRPTHSFIWTLLSAEHFSWCGLGGIQCILLMLKWLLYCTICLLISIHVTINRVLCHIGAHTVQYIQYCNVTCL